MISYYLNVLRLSVPLVIIYLLFCFSYLINDDDVLNISASNDEIVNDYKAILKSVPHSTNSNNDKTRKINDDNIKDPKPIVSYNPKPIIIDSNIIIQNKDNNSSYVKEDTSSYSSKVIQIIDNKSTLKLNEIMICRGIYKRNPIKPGFSFINDVDSLFCYTKITNSGTKQEIKHIWYFEDKEISAVVYNIKPSYNYRSWSKKRILAKQTGNWKVDVVDANGDVLGSRSFSIKSNSNTY